ncbi:MAG: acyl carrier protein [Frankiales bacterium]|jgi:acyl carrier protein|nr:acyl carrier protein [Frankiales bacterium]
MTLTQTDILTGLAEVLEEVSGVPSDKVTRDATFENDLEVDSLTMVEVVVACEERFGVRIPDEALESLKTVGDAIDYIATAGVPA